MIGGLLCEGLAGEDSLALVDESAHAVDLILVCEAQTEQVGLEEVAGDEVHLAAVVDGFLCQHDSVGAVGSDLCSQLLSGVKQLCLRNNLLYQTEGQSLVGLICLQE